MDGAFVGNGIALAEDFEGKIQHGLETIGESEEISAAQRLKIPRFAANARNGVSQAKIAEIAVDDCAIQFLARHSPSMAQVAGALMRIGAGQWLIGKPGVGNEPAGAGGTHDVATPECVNTENGVSNVLPKLIHYASSF